MRGKEGREEERKEGREGEREGGREGGRAGTSMVKSTWPGVSMMLMWWSPQEQ
jgi:hypothetical protein